MDSRAPAHLVRTSMASSQILFFSRSGDWWDAGLVLSAVIAGLAATAVGVFTAGSIMAHKREAKAAETSLETYKLGVEGRVADAKVAEIPGRSATLDEPA